MGDFNVTAIRKRTLGCVAAADAARTHVSKAGREQLASSGLTALSLFRFERPVGAVVDLRNLTRGSQLMRRLTRSALAAVLALVVSLLAAAAAPRRS